MTRIVPFYPEDLDALDPVAPLAQGGVETLRGLILPEMSRTAVHEGRILGAAGVIPLWKGVASGWALIDKGLPPGLVRGFILAAREAIPEIGPYHRIQADVRRDFTKGQRFIRALGFTHEGPLFAYGEDGADYDRFSFLRGERG